MVRDATTARLGPRTSSAFPERELLPKKSRDRIALPFKLLALPRGAAIL